MDLIKKYGLDLDKVTLKYTGKGSSETKDLNNFIKAKYGPKICSHLFKLALSVEERSDILKQFKPDNYLHMADDGAVYYCLIEGNGQNEAVLLYAWDPREWGGNYNGHITIPAEVTLNGKTYRVSGIGQGAFKGYTGLKSIDMPLTVNGSFSILRDAFENCSGLTSITMPQAVTSYFHISGHVFKGCTGLKSIDMPLTVNGSLHIFQEAFEGCTDLKSIDMQEMYVHGSTIIRKSAFKGLSNLKSIKMPQTVTGNFIIDSGAFTNCSELGSIKMPLTVNGNFNINEHAFKNCTGLISIDFPETIEGDLTVHISAFKEYRNLLGVIDMMENAVKGNLKIK